MDEQQSARVEAALERGAESGLFTQDASWRVFRLLDDPGLSVYRVQVPLDEQPIIVAYIENEEVNFDDADPLWADEESVNFGIDRRADRVRLRRSPEFLRMVNSPRGPASSHLKPLDVEVIVEDIH